MPEIDRESMTEIANVAAQKAVCETFRLFGVDINEQKQVNEFRADLVTARKVRRFLESSFGKISGLMFLALIMSALVTAGDQLKSLVGWKV
jgi:hypothetical protein